MNAERLLEHFGKISEAPDAVPRLRRFILDLAVRGKLVEQDPGDEPAGELLKRIEKKKDAILFGKKSSERQDNLLAVSPYETQTALPKGWAISSLGGLAIKITDGTHKTPTYVETGVPFVSVKDFSSGRLDLSRTRLIPLSEHVLLYRRCDPRRGDLLLGRIGTLGKAVIVDTDIEFSLFVSVGLIRFDAEVVNPEFAKCQINSPFIEKQFDGIKIGGATHTNKLNLCDLNSVQMVLPPLAEQHRIVVRVGELMALCEELEASQAKRERRRDRLVAASLHGLNNGDENAELGARPSFEESARFYLGHLPRMTTRPEHVQQLRQTILDLAVRGKLVEQDSGDEPAGELLNQIRAVQRDLAKRGLIKNPVSYHNEGNWEGPYGIPREWRWAKLGELISFGPQNGVSPKPTDDKNAPKALTLTATTSGSLNLTHYKHVDLPADECEKYWLSSGDFIFQRGNTREYVGIAAVFNGPRRTFVFPDLMIRVRFSELLCQRFIHTALISPPLRSYFSTAASGASSSMPKISQAVLLDAPISIPPLGEQQRIVEKVEELMRLCDEIEAGLLAATTGRSRLLEASLNEALCG